MRIFRHPAAVPASLAGAVLAIGNFDGVHRGHQALLAQARERARAAGKPLAVLTFEPHPRRLFQPDLAPFRLTPFRIKARHLEALGLDFLVVQRFNRGFAAVTAEAFADEVLAKGIRPSEVIVGYNFAYGHKRQGSIETLTAAGRALGFAVTIVAAIKGGHDEVYSSTLIRQHLAEGRPVEAAALLGHLWEIEGRVRHGEARGRELNVPTANIDLRDYVRSKPGIYAIRAGIDLGGRTEWQDGVGYFGPRPTLGGGTPFLEAHLFDFAGDLYGRHLRVALIEFLRGDQTFASLDALKTQMAEDIRQARAVLAARTLGAGELSVGPGRR
ncbi:MAG: bifunctional riboflavin kinase/FAD synthetase [Alphaproteobacteria bacterium]|nr:bifunctional riboflavin kinase/FAD synthetase [Alphaproteobacteria bacterium]